MIFHSNYIGFIVILCFQDLLRSNRFLNAFSYQHGSVFDSKNRWKTDKWWFQVASNKWSIFRLFFYRFGLRFGSHLGAMLASFFGPKRPRRLPRRFQDGPRRFHKRPGWPKIAQDASKPAPEPSRPRSWCLQAWILMVFWQNADPFLDGFGIILTMQIPSRLHVIEASKTFSKI